MNFLLAAITIWLSMLIGFIVGRCTAPEQVRVIERVREPDYAGRMN